MLAAVGGVLGAWYNSLNGYLTVFRSRGIMKRLRWSRWLEALIMAVLVGSLFFLVPAFAGNCVAAVDNSLVSPFYCAPDETNDLASLFFSGQDEAIRFLFNKVRSFVWCFSPTC